MIDLLNSKCKTCRLANLSVYKKNDFGDISSYDLKCLQRSSAIRNLNISLSFERDCKIMYDHTIYNTTFYMLICITFWLRRDDELLTCREMFCLYPKQPKDHFQGLFLFGWKNWYHLDYYLFQFWRDMIMNLCIFLPLRSSCILYFSLFLSKGSKQKKFTARSIFISKLRFSSSGIFTL